MPPVTIREAADRLHVSPDTIRRRLRSGALTGQQVSTGGRSGFTWYVNLPDDDAGAELAVIAPSGADLQQQVDDLRAERDRLLAIIEALAVRPVALPAGTPTQAKGRVGRAWDALRGR